MAKSNGVSGWSSMKKEQLVQALVKLSKQRARDAGKTVGSKNGGNGRRRFGGAEQARDTENSHAKPSRIARAIRLSRLQQESLKNLSLVNESKRSCAQPDVDRVILMVRDPFWLQAYWEITEESVRRARVALADSWFYTRPVLRLLQLTSNMATNTVEEIVREIPIHGGVRNWFLDVLDPPKTFRVALGYATSSGRFHLIAKSNKVTTPAPNNNDSFDHNWADITENYKKFYALSGGYSDDASPELQSVFEEKLRRPMNVPAFVRFGSGINHDPHDFDFQVDAHMVIHGSANPNANVTLAGEPIRLRDDGTFSVQLNLPDRRQVLPIVASSRDGTQQRTTVLSIERNTKVMEPVNKELDDL
jgi:hypothetical protein